MASIDRIFTEPLDTLSVEEILGIVRSHWYPGRAAHAAGDPVEAQARITQLIAAYQQNSVLNYWFPIPARTPGQKARAFLVKVVRKLVKPALLPIVNQQNDINLRVGVILAALAEQRKYD